MSASAFCKARYRLRHTAFIELHRKAVVESLYGDGEYRRYRGWRLLGIEGSKVLLPDSETVREEFGTIAFSNGKNGALAGDGPARWPRCSTICATTWRSMQVWRMPRPTRSISPWRIWPMPARATWCWPTATARPSACSPS
jgi:hypothetical protein